MRSLLLGLLLMTIIMPSLNWSEIINRLCAVSFASSPAATLGWPMTSRRRRFCAPTKICATFGARRVSPPGFTGSLTTVFGSTRANVRNWSASTKNNWSANTIRRRSIPHCQNGLSHDEAARVLDIPLGTVKTNVLRGREKLKRTLAEWGPN